MTIIEQRFLRGPNLWSRKCCLQTVIDFGDAANWVTTDLPGFSDDLLSLFPSMRDFAEPMLRGSFVAEVIGQLTLELQRLAGAGPDSCYVAAVRGKQKQVKIIVAYQHEQLAVQAFDMAIGVVRALCAGENIDSAAPLAALTETARHYAVGAGTAAVTGVARERGIPVIRLPEDPGVFQLGWGVHQKRLPAAVPGPVAPGEAEALVDAMFGSSDGRIPVIAVTGTNGKTTTSLMIEHCARMAGLATGVTTTEGVYIHGRRILEGDCAGYHSARVLLTSPEVEFAVLETARGGILKRGLAFDYCAVAVLLNVSADHLGLDGIETVEDLARVKAVVAMAASQAVVLNAADRHCVAMNALLGPDVERIYFSMEPENAVLLRHLEQRGRAVYFQDGALIVADGVRRTGALTADAMPSTLGGHALYNVANGLAAAAALMGAGFTQAQISAGLSSFVSDADSNPLRSNVYSARGVTIIVDYAHNPAAYAALAAMARSLTRTRRIAVLTCPGDRREDDLHDIGRTCAAGFDELFVYEADPRGRPSGETAGLILTGARGAGKDERTLHAVVPVADAFDAAMAHCTPGDVLVFACGSAATAAQQLARHMGRALPNAPAAQPGTIPAMASP